MICAFLYTFRPRFWPEYFHIGLFNGEDEREQIDYQNNLLVERYRVVPFLKSEINQSFFEGNSSSSRSFTSGQQVVLIDPFDATVREPSPSSSEERKGWLDRFQERQSDWRSKVFSNLIYGQS